MDFRHLNVATCITQYASNALNLIPGQDNLARTIWRGQFGAGQFDATYLAPGLFGARKIWR